MDKITKEEFVQFLKENNVHPFTFVRRWHERYVQIGRSNSGKFSEYFKIASTKALISGSFNWKETPEGQNFWWRMDIKYYEYLNKRKQ